MSRGLKIISVSLLGIAALAAGGHYYLWQQHATFARAQVEKAIAAVNAQKQMISYSAIATSGYPRYVEISIENPKVSGRVDEWMQLLADMGKASHLERAQQQAAIDALPEWTTDISLSGHIKLRSNLLADRYSVIVSGAITSASDIAGVKESSTSQPQGDSVCDIALSYRESLFDRLMMQLKSEAAAKGELAALNCNFPASRYVSESGEMLTSTAGAMLKLNLSPSFQPTRTITFAAEVKDAEFSPAGDKLIEMYARALSPQMIYNNRLSVYGKQNVSISFSFNGPTDLAQLGGEAPLDVAIDKFSFRNDAYQSDISLKLNKTTANGQSQGQLDLTAKSTFTPVYQSIIRDLFSDLAREALANPNPEWDLSGFTAESLSEALQPAIPDLASLGTLTQTLRANFSGNPAAGSGELNLTELELSATPYGITGKGKAARAAGQLSPTGNVELSCRQCPVMIDDIAAYTARLEQVLLRTGAIKPYEFPLDAATLGRFKSFLSQLAVKEAEGSWRFVIASSAEAPPSINGKPFAEVMALYQQLLMPAPQQP